MPMVLEKSDINKAILMKENGWIAKKKARVFTLILKVVFILEILIVMKKMAMEQCNIKMAIYTKVNGKMALDLEKVNIRVKAGTTIEESGWMIDFMALDYWCFQMEDFIMESGFKVKKLE